MKRFYGVAQCHSAQCKTKPGIEPIWPWICGDVGGRLCNGARWRAILVASSNPAAPLWMLQQHVSESNQINFCPHFVVLASAPRSERVAYFKQALFETKNDLAIHHSWRSWGNCWTWFSSLASRNLVRFEGFAALSPVIWLAWSVVAKDHVLQVGGQEVWKA